jgi:hypothetical protein
MTMRIIAAVLTCIWISSIGISPALAANGFDVADLWWDPNEPGWGLQVVQQSQTAYATLYVYDANRTPHWYNALLTPSGFNPLGGPTYTGALYESGGPYWATVPYDPGQFHAVAVGTFTFDSPSTTTAVITYVIGGVTVTKTLQRFSLTYEDFSGSYAGVYVVDQSRCTNSTDNGTKSLLTNFSIAQDQGSMTIVGAMSDGVTASTCTFDGLYSQHGSIGNFVGTYGCSTGEQGTVSFTEMGAQRFAIYGRISDGHNNRGCDLSGQFSATTK